MIDGTRKQKNINLFDHTITNDKSRFFCLIFFVFRVCGVTINVVSFVVIVDVTALDAFAAIITVDIDFLAVVTDVDDTGVAATTISADFVSFTSVIDVIVFDVTVVFAIDVVTDIIFESKVIVVITFALVVFTAVIIDIHLLAVIDVINVIVPAVIIIVVTVAIASFVVNDMIVDTGVVISICSTTLFLFRCCQRFFLFLFLDR